MDQIEAFGTFEEVASFALDEAFRYAHAAAEYEVAGILFAERLEHIDVTDLSWKAILPDSITDWLVNRDNTEELPLDSTTIQNMSDAWQQAQVDATASDLRLTQKQQLSSTGDVIGIVINLVVALETIVNCQLFFMREIGELDSNHFVILDRAELISKLLFCFKTEIQSRKFDISRLKRLVKLRNSAVHFRNGDLKLTIEDFVGICRQLAQLCSLTRGNPSGEEVQGYTDDFLRRWVDSKRTFSQSQV